MIRRLRAARMSDIAYVARYGHQARREIYSMTPAELRRWVKALSAIVEREQKDG